MAAEQDASLLFERWVAAQASAPIELVYTPQEWASRLGWELDRALTAMMLLEASRAVAPVGCDGGCHDGRLVRKGGGLMQTRYTLATPGRVRAQRQGRAARKAPPIAVLRAPTAGPTAAPTAGPTDTAAELST